MSATTRSRCLAIVAGFACSAPLAAQTAHPSGAPMADPGTTSPVTPRPASVAARAEGHAEHDQTPMPRMDPAATSAPHGAYGTSDVSTSLPRTPIPTLTDADRAAARPSLGGHTTHDDEIHSYALLNRLEGFRSNHGNGFANGFAWEGSAWIGTDLNRLWIRSEGERRRGRTEAADIEVLYGRSVSTWWDVVAGVRHDSRPGAPQDFAAIGVQGLAPMKFEVMATAYLGDHGQSAARFEAEYELLLTNRLILQPLVELNAYRKNDPARGIGAGLGTAEAGLRLRYEITRQFAPYLGIVREWSFGRTADARRIEGEAVHDTRIVTGIRIWF